jgi:hypothetical protein
MMHQTMGAGMAMGAGLGGPDGRPNLGGGMGSRGAGGPQNPG